MKKEILIVDDDKDFLTVLDRIFTELGWESYLAQDAKDALALFKTHCPPLILTDLRLGNDIGGVNICREIKNMAPLSIVAAMSGYYSEDYSISYLRRSGFDGLMGKPVTVDECKRISEFAAWSREAWDNLAAGKGLGNNGHS